MGYINEENLQKSKKAAAQQVLQWHDNAINAINQLQNYRQSLISHTLLIADNKDYTEEDRIETQGLIDSINEKLNSI
jgi:hypothetical protein